MFGGIEFLEEMVHLIEKRCQESRDPLRGCVGDPDLCHSRVVFPPATIDMTRRFKAIKEFCRTRGAEAEPPADVATRDRGRAPREVADD